MNSNDSGSFLISLSASAAPRSVMPAETLGETAK